MTLYSKRERFSEISESIGKAASRLGLSPNRWTMIGILCAVISAWFLASSNFLLAAIFVGVASMTDVIDGAVARYAGKASARGAYIDTIADRYTEAIIIAGLLFSNIPDVFLPVKIWVFAYFFGGIMTTYAKASASEKGLVKELRGGILERAERLMILLIGIILALYSTEYLTYTVIALAVLSNVSALQRIRIALSISRKHTNI